MLEPAGYRSLGEEMWRELGASLHGVLESQEQNSETGKLDFIGWINAHHPRYKWFEFNRRLAEILELVAGGLVKRLMIFTPPRHGKSELVSRLFTAYYLYRYPERWVGLTSYGATLAETLSRSARSNFKAGGGDIRFDSRAVTQWETTAGGGMWAAGVGGGITGKGGHLLVVDDPVKDAVEAASETTQLVHQEWWQSTFRSRLEPGGAIIVVQTRWHEMDLSGWLLTQELERKRPERWHIVAWEALKEPEEERSDEEELQGLQLAGIDPEKVQRVANYLWPTTCTLEPDWRQPGEALCPERYDVDDLLDIQDGSSTYFWSALYQQRPRPKDGLLFKLEDIQYVDAIPPLLVEVRFWDYAATEKTKSDWTSGVRLGIGYDNKVYIRHLVRVRLEPGARDKVIDDTMKNDGPWVHQGREQEPGSSGVDTALQFHLDHAGMQTFTKRATGSKFLRADGLAAAAQHGRLCVLRGQPWTSTFVDELIAFGSGTGHDDVVDSAAGAYNEAVRRAAVLARRRQQESRSRSLRILR